MRRKFKIFGKDGEVELRDEADMSVFEEIFVDRDYRMVEGILEKAQVVVDVGAHAGFFSLYARMANADAKIYAFEPAADNFQMMKENHKMNRVKDVVLKNVAVAGEDGQRQFVLSGDSHNHSFFGKGETIEVRAISLNTIFERYRLDEVDLVKMDCEGAEFEILESFEKFGQVKAFYLEFHEYQPGMERDKLLNLLRNEGYKCQIFPSRYDSRMGFVFAI